MQYPGPFAACPSSGPTPFRVGPESFHKLEAQKSALIYYDLCFQDKNNTPPTLWDLYSGPKKSKIS